MTSWPAGWYLAASLAPYIPLGALFYCEARHARRSMRLLAAGIAGAGCLLTSAAVWAAARNGSSAPTDWVFLASMAAVASGVLAALASTLRTRDFADALFYETLCSGRSLRSKAAKIIGINNVLRVTLRPGLFTARLMPPFRWLIPFSSWEIPLRSITRVETQDRWPGRSVKIYFTDGSGAATGLEVFLSRREELLARLGEQGVPI